MGLDGFGPGPGGPEVDEFAVVFGFFLGPQGAHGFEVFAQHGASPAGRDVVVGQFVGVPAEPDAQGDPAGGEVVEGGDGFGQGDRVVFDGQGHRGGQSDPGGDGGGAAEGDPGVQGAHVAVVGQGSSPVVGWAAWRLIGMWVCSGT